MAVNVPVPVYQEGQAVKVMLFRFVGWSSGDTFDMSGYFKKVLASYLITADTEATSVPAISANTTLTPGLAAQVLVSGWLLVTGDSL